MERTPAGIDRSLDNEFVEETPSNRKDMLTMFQQVLMEALPDLAEQIVALCYTYCIPWAHPFRDPTQILYIHTLYMSLIVSFVATLVAMM